MITGVTAGRLTTAAHLGGRQILTAGSSIMIDDHRIRNWSASNTGSLTAIPTPAWISASAVSGTGNTTGIWYYFVVCALSGSNQSTASNIASASAMSTTPNSARFGVSFSGVPVATAYIVYKASGTANGGLNFDY